MENLFCLINLVLFESARRAESNEKIERKKGVSNKVLALFPPTGLFPASRAESTALKLCLLLT